MPCRLKLAIPKPIRAALDKDAVFSLSLSGGKDSQAMIAAVQREFSAEWMELIHADLGKAEWPQTPAFVDHLAHVVFNLPLAIVRRTKGDLVDRIKERLNTVSTVDPTRPAKPFWPSAAQRYCTSDLKRDPIHKHQRSVVEAGILVSWVGFRAEESTGRAKRPILSVEKRISSKQYRSLSPAQAVRRYSKGRLVLNWLPIHSWTIEDVWEELGTSVEDLEHRRQLYRENRETEALEGWPAHAAYVYGNERLSCALCVLGCIGDLKNGKKHHPELYQIFVDLEKKSGYTFRDGFSLTELSDN